MNKISVIIPVYNVELYLDECLKSLLKQTHTNLEIVCVEDCGTDSSLAILERYKTQDSRIKIVRTAQNMGIAHVRNLGLKSATGDYIFYLDSDDYLASDTILEHLLQKILEDDSDFVFSRTATFSEEVSSTHRAASFNKRLNKFPTEPIQIDAENFVQFVDSFPAVVWGRLYKTSFLRKNNIQCIEKNVVHEDNNFCLKCLVNMPKVSFLPEVGVMYRLRSNSITDNVKKRKGKNVDRSQINVILEDAFEYIRTQKGANGEYFIYAIKYICNFYSKSFKRAPFIFEWRKNYKRLSFWRFSPFCIKYISPNIKQVTFLGISFRYHAKPFCQTL